MKENPLKRKRKKRKKNMSNKLCENFVFTSRQTVTNKHGNMGKKSLLLKNIIYRNELSAVTALT